MIRVTGRPVSAGIHFSGYDVNQALSEKLGLGCSCLTGEN
jgi:hypothetical protein